MGAWDPSGFEFFPFFQYFYLGGNVLYFFFFFHASLFLISRASKGDERELSIKLQDGVGVSLVSQGVVGTLLATSGALAFLFGPMSNVSM